MTSENLPAARPAGRPNYVRYSRPVLHEILLRVTNGESVHAICKDAWMPNENTVRDWARARPRFAERLAKARRLAGRYGANAQMGRFCPVTSQEIFLRLAGGETMKSICADPEMPAETTVARWRRLEPEFDEALKVAREIQAERFADDSVEMMDQATPETGFVTGVKLAHIRWLAAVHGPRTFSRTKPREAPVEPTQVVTFIRHFKVETREDGMTRFVSYVADPARGGVVRDSASEWRPPKDEAEAEAPAVRAARRDGEEWL